MNPLMPPTPRPMMEEGPEKFPRSMRRVAGSIRPDSGWPLGPIAVVVLMVEMTSDVVDLWGVGVGMGVGRVGVGG